MYCLFQKAQRTRPGGKATWESEAGLSQVQDLLTARPVSAKRICWEEWFQPGGRVRVND